MAGESSSLDKILAAFKSSSTFCFTGHKNPDADVVGSQLGLLNFLKRWHPKSPDIKILNCGRPPEFMSFLPGYSLVQSTEKVEGKFDAAVIFECSGEDRTGNILDLKNQAKTVINLDHHLHNPYFGTLNFVEPETSSLAELIYKIIDHAGVGITPEEANCLYIGMVADTGWFRYGNTTPQTHQIASKVVQAGVKVDNIGELFFMSRTKAALSLLGWCLSHIKYFFDDRLSLLTIPENIFTSMGATSEDEDEIVNYGLKLKQATVSVLLKERKNPAMVKVSLRSKGNVDINQIAREFGGGGHRNASGCMIPGTLEEVELKVLPALRRLY